jgi:hypothetical protein
MNEKYELAARLTANMVMESLAKRHDWSHNETLSRMSKANLYVLLTDSDTGLWMDNPSDIADMFDLEFQGKPLPHELFFK